jgi:DNA repair protein RecN (Recombination protein N)
MLSLKSLISNSLEIPTVIFDEIDSGVSGDIADKVGNMIGRIAIGRQVLNITHLPQVASKGDFHYKVFKYDDAEATHTTIKLLSEEERVTELAQMLSGQNITPEAIQNARVLLNR